MDKVAIVGFYQVKPGLDIMMSSYEMLFEATRGALDHAGLKRDDLSTVIGCTNDYYDGKTISTDYDTLGEIVRRIVLRCDVCGNTEIYEADEFEG